MPRISISMSSHFSLLSSIPEYLFWMTAELSVINLTEISSSNNELLNFHSPGPLLSFSSCNGTLIAL